MPAAKTVIRMTISRESRRGRHAPNLGKDYLHLLRRSAHHSLGFHGGLLTNVVSGLIRRMTTRMVPQDAKRHLPTIYSEPDTK